jgi:hypothetical protein
LRLTLVEFTKIILINNQPIIDRRNQIDLRFQEQVLHAFHKQKL